ncbi:hypothetical protein XAB3213_1070027 [Xanthomonas citri pv. bilvae]|nr:hypothetical protein XAB3213_1070027 [Xanthomonas citri pv. bilvae]
MYSCIWPISCLSQTSARTAAVQMRHVPSATSHLISHDLSFSTCALFVKPAPMQGRVSNTDIISPGL